MIDVYWLSVLKETPCRGYWDQGIIEELLEGYNHHEVQKLTPQNFAIVVLPARAQYKEAEKINAELQKLNNVLLIITGDEEAVFPVDKIKHNSIDIWVQYPRPELHDDYVCFGCGCPPAIKEIKVLPTKDLKFFFSGQVTHIRRQLCFDNLQNIEGGEMYSSKGFTQGFPQLEYYQKMANAKVVPCPSGPETPDTFRAYEALELGCVPIVDTITPKQTWVRYWEWLFNSDNLPFIQISNYDDLKSYIEEAADLYPIVNNRIQAWWQMYKSDLKHKLNISIDWLSLRDDQKDVTIIVPVSPIPSHPDTVILMKTLKSIRYHFPKSRIIVTFDGVRQEQANYLPAYEEFIRRSLWEFRFMGDIYPMIFNEHLHQSGMMKKALEQVHTQLILYVEQDTPIVTDELIEWDILKKAILNGESNMIRLHFEGIIPEPHKELMIGSPENKLLKTIQWSQRPHIASTAFYKRIMTEQFSKKSKCFIEDLLHGRLQEDYKVSGLMGWNQWRVHIYFPDIKNIKRSYHLDGRAGSKKYDDVQQW